VQFLLHGVKIPSGGGKSLLQKLQAQGGSLLQQ
jgi:hypothetical protein